MPQAAETEHVQQNKGPVTIIVSTVLTAIALLLVMLRLLSRRISRHKLAVDDYLVVLSLAINIVYLALCGVAVHYGAGRHSRVLTPAAASTSVFYILIAFVFGVFSFTVPKFAVLILLGRILYPSVTHKRVMWVVSVVYSLQGIGMIVINYAQCSPPAAQWRGAEGTCWPRTNTFAYSLALGITSAMFDFYLAIYPTVVLSKLHMGRRKKLGLSSALGFGYCAGAVTIYKCTTLTGLKENSDYTYNFQDIVLWTSIEANCVLIGACIPTLYPLMKKIFGAAVLGSLDSRYGMRQGHQAIQTIGSYGKPRRRPWYHSALDTAETGHGGNGHVDSGGVGMTARQGSGNSGETTLRDDDGDVPIVQPSDTRRYI